MGVLHYCQVGSFADPANASRSGRRACAAPTQATGWWPSILPEGRRYRASMRDSFLTDASAEQAAGIWLMARIPTVYHTG